MAELIVTCANCGKRYRGAQSGKKFKCTGCGVSITFPEAALTPPPGKILCSNCWIEIDLEDNPAVCPACDQKVKVSIGGKAVVPGASASSHAVAAVAASGSHPSPGADADLHVQVTALTREREALLEDKKKQEKVLGELMAQLAFSKATQAAAETDADEPARWELQMEVGELRSRLDSQEEQHKKLIKEREEARKAREEVEDARRKLEARVYELESQLAALEQSQAQALQAAKQQSTQQVNLELERKVTQLEQDVTAAREQRDAAIKERDEAHSKVSQAQADLDHFREVAVQALEPLGLEYNKSMKELITESDALISKARQQHEEANQRMSQLDALGASLKDHLMMVRREMAQRLAQVLGGPADESSSGEPAVVDEPKKPDEKPTSVA